MLRSENKKVRDVSVVLVIKRSNNVCKGILWLLFLFIYFDALLFALFLLLRQSFTQYLVYNWSFFYALAWGDFINLVTKKKYEFLLTTDSGEGTYFSFDK